MVLEVLENPRLVCHKYSILNHNRAISIQDCKKELFNIYFIFDRVIYHFRIVSDVNYVCYGELLKARTLCDGYDGVVPPPFLDVT